jgi:isopentenyldiphosphate isomerase
LDHVLTAKFEGETPFNPDEVHALTWRSIADIQRDMKANPSGFTAWFQIIFKEYLNHLTT